MTTSYEEKIEACLQVSNVMRLSHLQDIPVWILWRIWKSRNLLLYHHRQLLEYVLGNARSDAREWKNADQQETDTLNCNSVSSGVRKK